MRNLRFSILVCLAVLLVRDIHEWIHQFTNFLFSGNIPTRDFINWTPTNDLSDYKKAFIYLSAPIFNFLVSYTGLVFLERLNDKFNLALVLIFASNPFLQFLALISKGGDIWIASQLFTKSFGYILPFFFVISYLILFYKVFRKLLIQRNYSFILYFFVFPSLFEMVSIKFVFNPLFKSYVGSNTSNYFFVCYDFFIMILLLPLFCTLSSGSK